MSQTRRSLLLGGITASVMAATPISLVHGEQSPPTKKRRTAIHKGDYKVSYYQADDARHSKLLKDHFPALVDDPVFAKIAPLALIMVHRKGPAIQAYAVNWSLHQSGGVVSENILHYKKPSSLPSRDGYRPWSSAKRPVVRENEIVLVTPFFAWSVTQYRHVKRDQVPWDKFIKMREPGCFLLNEVGSANSVDIKLDSVVFHDSKIIGADRAQLALRIKERRHGEHDLAVHVRKLIKAGATEDAVKEDLSVVAGCARPKGSKREVMYRLSQRAYAGVLLGYLNKKGSAKLARMSRRIAKQGKTHIEKVAI